MYPDTVPLLVHVPRKLRICIRVESARREWTITQFVIRALEAALHPPALDGHSGTR